MEWTAEGLIIGVRRHGESGVILETLAAGQGRHLGLVRGGRSPRQAATLQIGNTVLLTWRARLAEHLGHFTAETLTARAAALMADRTRLYAAQTVADLLRLLPERDPHDYLLAVAVDLLDTSTPGLGPKLARFELLLLEELGFGLDLSACALTGDTHDLAFVSPKTGRAASRQAGAPYADKLLALPTFLLDEAAMPGPGDLGTAFALTGHFLHRHVWDARQVPPPAMREELVRSLG